MQAQERASSILLRHPKFRGSKDAMSDGSRGVRLPGRGVKTTGRLAPKTVRVRHAPPSLTSGFCPEVASQMICEVMCALRLMARPTPD